MHLDINSLKWQGWCTLVLSTTASYDSHDAETMRIENFNFWKKIIKVCRNSLQAFFVVLLLNMTRACENGDSVWLLYALIPVEASILLTSSHRQSYNIFQWPNIDSKTFPSNILIIINLLLSIILLSLGFNLIIRCGIQQTAALPSTTLHSIKYRSARVWAYFLIVTQKYTTNQTFFSRRISSKDASTQVKRKFEIVCAIALM